MTTTLRYKHLSAGYIGIALQESTLNARFYSKILNTLHEVDHKIHFPQRTPKIDFFTELNRLETNNFREAFLQIKSEIKLKIAEFSKDSRHNQAIKYSNYINLMFRFGMFDEILKIEIPKQLDLQDFLAINFIKEVSKAELSLSYNQPLPMTEILHLTSTISVDQRVDIRLKITVLLRAVVLMCRHLSYNDNYQQDEYKHAQLLLKFIEEFSKNDFPAIILRSIVYRGLAMVRQFGKETQNHYMQLAEKFAREAVSSTPLENIIGSENLYTCLQTLTKWNSYLGNMELSKENLQEMIRLDPYDSVGYSELGFFLLKQKSFDEASENFLSAAKLGPPGVGMNTYYYAKCLYELGNKIDAISMLNEAANLDEQAITPWLDLMEIYMRENDSKSAKNIAMHVLETSILKEQLEEEEHSLIQDIVSN